MGQMVLHCGASHASEEEIKAVPLPEKTQTYTPVAHWDLISQVRALATDYLDLPVAREQFGLNNAGKQLFGVITLDAGHAERGLSMGLKNSYNKSLGMGFCSGAQVFVCDNLAFSGEEVVLRRHTGPTAKIWEDLRSRITLALSRAKRSYERIGAQMDAMKAIPVSTEGGYDLIGRAYGNEVIAPQQASKIFSEWRPDDHDQFPERTLYRLYMAFTEGLKRGAASGTLERHAKVHDFFLPMVPATT